MTREGPRSTFDVTIDAAVRSFSTRGYEGTSMRDLASDVGVKPASLYNHFDSKEDLLWRIVKLTIDDLEARQNAALIGLDDPWDRMEAFVETHIRFHAENAERARIVNTRMYGLSPDRFERVRQFRDRYEVLLRDIVIAGVHSGSMDVQHVKLTTYAILQMGAAVANWYSPDGELNVEELVLEYMEFARRLTAQRGQPC